jgi:hypothetical protein
MVKIGVKNQSNNILEMEGVHVKEI